MKMNKLKRQQSQFQQKGRENSNKINMFKIIKMILTIFRQKNNKKVDSNNKAHKCKFSQKN